MEYSNPDEIRLRPGQCFEALFSAGPDDRGEVALCIRSASGTVRRDGDLSIRQRAGLIRFNDVLLVVTMVKLDDGSAEFFDIWWNYHETGQERHFERMSEQERLSLHFYGKSGRDFSTYTNNTFKSFFASLPKHFESVKPWTDIEFDRAVRGFCAQSYPKDNLWDMISNPPEMAGISGQDFNDFVSGHEYPGYIPEELKPFYAYLPEGGHCIKIIPSTFEREAVEADPDSLLLPAPVKTVLRCGIRWVKGYPVAPVPFIPGHGLAVPPEDTEY